MYVTVDTDSQELTNGAEMWVGRNDVCLISCVNQGGGEDKDAIKTASLDLGNIIARPNQNGQLLGTCTLTLAHFIMDCCHGSSLGGGMGYIEVWMTTWH